MCAVHRIHRAKKIKNKCEINVETIYVTHNSQTIASNLSSRHTHRGNHVSHRQTIQFPICVHLRTKPWFRARCVGGAGCAALPSCFSLFSRDVVHHHLIFFFCSSVPVFFLCSFSYFSFSFMNFKLTFYVNCICRHGGRRRMANSRCKR